MFAVPPNTVPPSAGPSRAQLSNAGSSNAGPPNAGPSNAGLPNAGPPHAADQNRAPAHPVRTAHEFAANRDSWAHLLRYDPDQRWFGLLERTAEHEVWLLSWLPGQRTELHDHGGATGAFTVVSGSLTERAVRPDSRPAEVLHPLVAGQSRVFGPNYVHQVHNDGPDPAVSIHVYRPARARMSLYEWDEVRGLVRA